MLMDVADVIAICENELQLAPLHCSMRYPLTPALSVDAAQLNPTCVLEEAVAVRLAGAVGAVVSPDGGSAVRLEPVHPCRINTSGRNKKGKGTAHSFFRGRFFRTAVLRLIFYSTAFIRGRTGRGSPPLGRPKIHEKASD